MWERRSTRRTTREPISNTQFSYRPSPYFVQVRVVVVCKRQLVAWICELHLDFCWHLLRENGREEWKWRKLFSTKRNIQKHLEIKGGYLSKTTPGFRVLFCLIFKHFSNFSTLKSSLLGRKTTNQENQIISFQ